MNLLHPDFQPFFPTEQEPTDADPYPVEGRYNATETDPPAAAGPTLLNQFTRCCKKMTASAVTKNLAGLMFGAGVGATFGCPWVIGLFIAAGVGTSWIGGVGIALIGVGFILWTASTILKARQEVDCTSLPVEIGVSAFMGVVGIPYVIFNALGNRCNSVCCGAQLNNDDDVSAAKRKQNIEQRYGLDLPASVRQTPPDPYPHDF